jgi:hypothetical protein
MNDMENPRTYGQPPYTVAVLHSGPGGPGYMAQVARELSTDQGILEPLQNADSLEGQVQESWTVLKDRADLPVVLHDAFRMFDRNHQNLYHTLNQDRTAPAMDESRWTFPTNPRMNSPNS